ncbi:UNVERIFIED_CONTAM: hypothetical protein HHA_226385 [Hammondia hammondi]|eukprot:XP_008882009.1 hypothetical protein HHA_226385 [Hammondia hammondi]
MKNIVVNGCTRNKHLHVQIEADSWFSFLWQDLGRRKLTAVTGVSVPVSYRAWRSHLHLEGLACARGIYRVKEYAGLLNE